MNSRNRKHIKKIKNKTQWLIWCLLLMVISTNIFSQNRDGNPKELAKGLQQASERHPDEEVYIQTNKGIYETGENLWFKGYVLLSQYLFPSTMSKTMYVELLKMPEKKPVWEEKYTVENGFVDGHLYIQDSLQPGQYVLVAQTPHSINSNEKVIKSVRKIEIIQNVSTLPDRDTVTDALESKPDEINFNLMPEGGHLVSGLQNKVAFKAVDQEGLPRNVSGTLYEDGNPLVRFKSLHAGMGSFSFVSDYKKKYHIGLEGFDAKFDLPDIKPVGQVLQLLSNKSDTLAIVVAQSPDLSQQNMFIRIQIRGVVYGMAEFSLNRKKLLKIPVREFPRGIAELTLFNRKMKPVAERLVFVNQDRKLFINTIPDKDAYFTRGKIKLKIQVTDEEKNPVVAHLGLSVYDNLYRNLKDPKSIESHYLLSTALKGRIYDPGYYFNPKQTDRHEALDLLMLTQGWRAYEWREANLIQLSDNKQLFITDTLTGQVYAKKRKAKSRVGNQYVMAFAGDTESGKTLIEVDSHGLYSVLPEYLQQKKRGYMYFKLLNDTKDLGISIDDPSFRRLDKLLTDNVISYPLPKPNEKNPVNNERSYVLANNVILMDEMVVTGKKKQVFRDKYMGTLDSLAKLDINNDYVCESNFLNCEVHEFADKKSKPVEGETYGQYVGFQWNESRTAYTIQGRKYITYHYPKFTREELLEKYNLASIKGYYPQKEFYSPVYDIEGMQDPLPDYRNTLYWKPDIITDKNGEAEVEFYASDLNTKFRGVIEGVSGGGLLGRSEFELFVK